MHNFCRNVLVLMPRSARRDMSKPNRFCPAPPVYATRQPGAGTPFCKKSQSVATRCADCPECISPIRAEAENRPVFLAGGKAAPRGGQERRAAR